MNKTVLFNFTVDKEAKMIKVERSFDAPVDIVWEAWTDPKITDQWWAPKPWRAETKSQEFKVGGRWIYCMVGPEGERHWAMFEYKSINPKTSYSGMDAFSDENGVINPEMPRMNWDNQFLDKGDTTVVNIEISCDKLEDLEKIIEMGFKEGFTMGLENLDAFLAGKK
ncbi:MAG: SRPBCC family protein [Flavisolibacter sp.]